MYRKAFLALAFMAFALTACRINTAPVIESLLVYPNSGTEPLNTTISISVKDPDGDPITCKLDLGDGSPELEVDCSSATVNHTYSAGTYTITLYASDNRGGNASKSASVNVASLANACPKPSTLSLNIQTYSEDEEPEGVSLFDGMSYKPGELIVYSPPLSLQSADVSSLEKDLGIQKVASLKAPGWVLYKVPEGSEKKIAQEIVATGLGKYVQPNYKYKLLYTPNDPYYTSTTQTSYGTGSQQTQYELMGVETAWDELIAGGCQPIVGVIDTGVAYDHPDLSANVITGYDFSNNDPDPYPEIDPNDPQAESHGTMVASIIGAETDNDQGMAGVSYNLAYIMPLKVFPNAYSSVIANAIDWAVDNGAHILNLSLCITDSTGACADLTNNPDATIDAALQRAYDSGVVSLAASGNYDDDFVGYPASSAYTIAVGASDNNDPPDRAAFSNYGDLLDVVAPGVAVLGAGIPTSDDPEPYLAGDGTSFATPYAAGVMALYLSQYNALNGSLPDPDIASACMRSAAQDLGINGFDVYTGMGLVRADQMLDTDGGYGCY